MLEAVKVLAVEVQTPLFLVKRVHQVLFYLGCSLVDCLVNCWLSWSWECYAFTRELPAHPCCSMGRQFGTCDEASRHTCRIMLSFSGWCCCFFLPRTFFIGITTVASVCVTVRFGAVFLCWAGRSCLCWSPSLGWVDRWWAGIFASGVTNLAVGFHLEFVLSSSLFNIMIKKT